MQKIKPHERELVSVTVACTLIEAKNVTARAWLYASGVVRETPFGPRVGLNDLRQMISNLPVVRLDESADAADTAAAAGDDHE